MRFAKNRVFYTSQSLHRDGSERWDADGVGLTLTTLPTLTRQMGVGATLVEGNRVGDIFLA